MAVATQLVQYILAIVDQLCNRKSELQNKKAITKKYNRHMDTDRDRDKDTGLEKFVQRGLIHLRNW
jgi:hypothetical protein